MHSKSTPCLPALFLCISFLVLHFERTVSQPISGDLMAKSDPARLIKPIWNHPSSESEMEEFDLFGLTDEDVDAILKKLTDAYEEYHAGENSKSLTPVRRANFWKRANFWRKRANFWRRRSTS